MSSPAEAQAGGGLRTRIARGLRWSAGRTAGHFVIQFATVIVISRLLMPAEVGVVAVAFGIVQLVLSFSLMGLDGAIVQRPSLSREHVGSAFLCTLAAALALFGAICATADRIAGLIGIAEAGPALAALSTVVLLHAVAGVFEALARRDLLIRLVAATDLLAVAVGYSAVAIGCALGGLGLWSLVAGHIGYFAVRALSLGLLLWRRWPLSASRGAVADLFRFGIPVSIANAADQVGANFDRILVGGMLGAEIAGLYHRGRQALDIAHASIQQPLATVLFPAMSRVQEERHKLALAFRSAVAVNGLVTIPCAVLIWLTSDPLVVFLLGPDWAGAVTPVRMLAAGLVLRAYDGNAGMLVLSANRPRLRALFKVIFVGLLIAGAAAGAPFGIAWICAGVVTAMALNALIMAFFAARILGLDMRRVLAPLTPGAVAAAAILAGAEVYRIALGAWAGSVAGSIAFIVLAGLFLAYVLLVHRGWPHGPEIDALRTLLREGRGMADRQT